MNVLVAVAHPDDEVLGAGGTIARLSAAGHAVDVLIVADGETSRAGASAGAVSTRAKAATAAAGILGARAPRLLSLTDQKLDTMSLLDIIRPIEQAAREIAPEIVYTHNPNDLNVDHRIVAQAVMTAFRPISGSPVRAIYACEVASSTEWASAAGESFVPRRFVDISATLAKKIEALQCYAAELRPFPHPRSTEAVEALARWRGASSGFMAAEAFDILREREG
jgi:LmbE family N-acetylglucosaminyl deacetylase